MPTFRLIPWLNTAPVAMPAARSVCVSFLFIRLTLSFANKLWIN